MNVSSDDARFARASSFFVFKYVCNSIGTFWSKGSKKIDAVVRYTPPTDPMNARLVRRVEIYDTELRDVSIPRIA